MDTYEDARIADSITRAEMAKMIVAFASSFLPASALEIGKTGIPATRGKCISFSDLTEVNKELQNYIVQACGLGLMGYYANGKDVKPRFSPYDTVTIAEF
jgi:hypothetical protein